MRLRWIGASGDKVGSDPLLLAVLGAVPGVVDSELARSIASPHAEKLELRLGGADSATITRVPGTDTVDVVRYWAVAPDWDARGDDEYSQRAAMLAASTDDDGAGGRRADRRRRPEGKELMTTTLEARRSDGNPGH